MDHTDHVNLLRPGVPEPGGVWADFGAGGGAFTLALAELIGQGGELHAIDRDANALRSNERALHARFGAERAAANVTYHEADYTHRIDLPALDGLVAANTLHFQRRPGPVVQLLRSYLQRGGRMLVVEYNIERGNFAVPHPLPFARWRDLATEAGFANTELLAVRPSRFLHEIYSAASW